MIRIELPDRRDSEDIAAALEVAAQILPPPTGPRMAALAAQVGRSLRTLPPHPRQETPMRDYPDGPAPSGFEDDGPDGEELTGLDRDPVWDTEEAP